MKMVILIVKNQDADEINQALTSEKYRVTRVASTGGFLRSGVVTFLIGTRDERGEGALELIHKTQKPLPSVCQRTCAASAVPAPTASLRMPMRAPIPTRTSPVTRPPTTAPRSIRIDSPRIRVMPGMVRGDPPRHTVRARGGPPPRTDGRG